MHRLAKIGALIAASYRETPQSDEDLRSPCFDVRLLAPLVGGGSALRIAEPVQHLRLASMAVGNIGVVKIVGGIVVQTDLLRDQTIGG